MDYKQLTLTIIYHNAPPVIEVALYVGIIGFCFTLVFYALGRLPKWGKG